MAKPWYRRLFSRAPAPAPASNRTLANAGDAAAQFALGMESSGTGALHDFAAAANWYRKAADQNHPVAQFNLGLMLAQGQGLERNDDAALSWITKAAEAGEAGAQSNLGNRCYRLSLDKNQPDASELRIEAYKWLHLSTAQGYKNSVGACELVSMRMTPEEIAEGNQRVASFVPKPANDIS